MKRTIDHQKEGEIRGMKRFLVLLVFTVVFLLGVTIFADESSVVIGKTDVFEPPTVVSSVDVEF